MTTRTGWLIAALLMSAGCGWGQFGDNARYLAGRPLCAGAPASGAPLTWNATGKCWGTGGPVTVGNTVLNTTCPPGVDQTAALNAQLAALYTAGGGTLVVSGVCLISGQLVIPNNGGTIPTQPTYRITGAGASANGTFGALPQSPSGLDMRVNASVAKIDTRGQGLLEIDHLNLVDGGSDCSPFIQSTNTTLRVHDATISGTASGASACNDAIVLGGTTTTFNGLSTGAFQGYGTVIVSNFFNKIRRGVYGKVYVNNLVIRDNAWSLTCGATGTVGAIEFDPNSQASSGQFNIIEGNLFEVPNYVYAVVLHAGASGNVMMGNGIWDGTSTTVGVVALVGSVGQSLFVGNPINGSYPALTVDNSAGSGTNHWFWLDGNGWKSGDVEGMLNVRTDLGGGFQVNDDAGHTMAIDIGSGFVRNSGTMDFYAGTGTTDMVRIMRGPLRLLRLVTTARPAASIGAGAEYFDTTLNLPLWSNGTNWTDAAGNIH